jgi:hypothetical protein
MRQRRWDTRFAQVSLRMHPPALLSEIGFPIFLCLMLSDVSLTSMKIAASAKPHWFSTAQLSGDPLAGRS